VRFTIQKCTIEELAQSEIAVSEVRARTAIGDYDNAFALAEAANRIEVRFRLLGAIARARKEAGLGNDPILDGRIRSLFDQLEPEALGSQLLDTASDLFYTAPDMAIELVSRGAQGNGGENAIDWALAGLAIQAQLMERDANAPKRAAAITERIQDPAARRLSTEASFILGRLTAGEAIAESKLLDTTGDRLYVLQHWMRSNRSRADASTVLEHGLTLLIQASGYTGDARVCRELSLCLPYIDDLQRVSYFIARIDAQRAVLEQHGPSEEFVRLQLLLARAEWRHDQAAATVRLEDVYNTVGSLKDPVVRTTALARLAGTLARIDPLHALDGNSDLHQLVDFELNEGVALLLKCSANQDEVLRGVVEALALRKPYLGLSIIERANTEWRRDYLYREFVESVTAMPLMEVDVHSLQAALDRIVDIRVHDATLHFFISGVARRRTGPDDALHVLPLVLRIANIHDAALRAATAGIAVRLLGPHKGAELMSARAGLLKLAKTSWTALDDDWRKLDLGFDLVADIATLEPSTAAELVTLLNGLKSTLALQDEEAVLAARLGIRLAIRAFGGLLSRSCDKNEDFDRLIGAIGQCAGVEEQTDLLAELIQRCELARRHEEARELTEKRLLPLLSSVPHTDAGRRYRLIKRAASALHAGATHTATALLTDLPDLIRDEALLAIAQFKFTKTPTEDPYDSGPQSGYDISIEDAHALLSIARQITCDWAVYSVIERLVDSAAGAAYSKNFNRPQKADLARLLEELAMEKFPNPRFIQHDGYRLVALAQINRLKEKADTAPILNLIAQARKIPNVSDRAYVIAIIASTCRAPKDRHTYLDEAKAIVDSMPILEERLDQYYAMSRRFTKETNISKELLKSAMIQSLGEKSDSLDDRRRSLIDLAYRLDPEFASSLVALTNDDPAKQKAESRLQMYRLRDALVASEIGDETKISNSDAALSRAAWMRLGSLNANRARIEKTERTLPILSSAARQPLSVAYPIFAWFTQNAIQKTGNTGTLQDYVLPLFEAYLRGAELAIRASVRTSRLGASAMAFAAVSISAGEGTLIADGERHAGLQHLREWLISTSPKQLRIIEPYFGPDDAELLALVREASDQCDIVVVAGRKESLTHVAAPYEEAYRDAWYRVCAGDPPPTTLVFAGARSTGKFPVHDRWWLTEDGGLYLGTSFNGIGSRVSTVRVLDAQEATRKMAELSPYFAQTRLEFEGEKLAYHSFTL
jgi:hypothetical protein